MRTKLKYAVRFYDEAFEAGTEVEVAEGTIKDEILRAMKDERVLPDTLAKMVDDAQLRVVRINNKWRLVSADKIES